MYPRAWVCPLQEGGSVVCVSIPPLGSRVPAPFRSKRSSPFLRRPLVVLEPCTWWIRECVTQVCGTTGKHAQMARLGVVGEGTHKCVRQGPVGFCNPPSGGVKGTVCVGGKCGLARDPRATDYTTLPAQPWQNTVLTEVCCGMKSRTAQAVRRAAS